MSERIPQSIAKRVVFRAFLASDHVTPATGKTIAITISKNGGAFANPAAGATNATAISNGYYYFDLGTGDTGTLGPLAYLGAEGTIDDVGDVYSVTDEIQAIKTQTAAIEVDTADIQGRLPAALVSGRIDASVGAMAANVMTAAAAAADLTTELQSGLATAASLTTVEGKIDTIDDYLDTELAALTTAVADLPTNAELATALGTADDAVLAAIAALNDITVADIIAGVADGSYDLQEMMRVIFSACAGKSSGHESGTPAYRDAADTKNRISATTDANGNRTAVTLDAT